MFQLGHFAWDFPIKKNLHVGDKANVVADAKSKNEEGAHFDKKCQSLKAASGWR
jgi:multidrug resistance efflux pump